ncbi:uncharacterized protein LOC125552668 [Triticum urartu]|uniref:uncharacterized protein LOC125552668 n=1 Tax=Triticum urartu TaxID=4572 RepID=UPI002042F934|nr:uncharacterized protein LOC125552668 [Triticum urartu]
MVSFGRGMVVCAEIENKATVQTLLLNQFKLSVSSLCSFLLAEPMFPHEPQKHPISPLTHCRNTLRRPHVLHTSPELLLQVFHLRSKEISSTSATLCLYQVYCSKLLKRSGVLLYGPPGTGKRKRSRTDKHVCWRVREEYQGHLLEG